MRDLCGNALPYSTLNPTRVDLTIAVDIQQGFPLLEDDRALKLKKLSNDLKNSVRHAAIKASAITMGSWGYFLQRVLLQNEKKRRRSSRERSGGIAADSQWRAESGATLPSSQCTLLVWVSCWCLPPLVSHVNFPSYSFLRPPQQSMHPWRRRVFPNEDQKAEFWESHALALTFRACLCAVGGFVCMRRRVHVPIRTCARAHACKWVHR